MTLWLALRRLLPLLAVLSLALTPATASAAAAGMHAAIPEDQGMAGMDHAPMYHAHMHHAAMDQHEAGSVDRAGMAMDAMPCCPKMGMGKRGIDETEAEEGDCAKGCPLMALCLASVASLLPAALSVPVPVATRASLSWPDPATFASVHGPPLPEPPRA